MAGDSTAADVLRLLADCESTGTLELTGPPSGAFRLERGMIAAVVTDAVPDLATRLARGTPAAGTAERLAVARSVVLDGATVLLAKPLSAPPRFFAGAPDPSFGEHTEPSLRVDVPELLAEATARLALLAEAPVGPDDVVTVRPVLGRRSVRLGPIAWQLLRGLQEPRSARSLAWGFGLGLVDTLIAIADMVDQQACEARRPAGGSAPPTGPIFPPGPAGGAPRPGPTRPQPVVATRPGSGPGPGPGSAAPATVLTTLPRRRVVSGLAGSGQQRLAVPDRDLLLRVLEGLRRL